MYRSLRLFPLIAITTYVLVTPVCAQKGNQPQGVVDPDVWFGDALASSVFVGLSACVVSDDHVVWRGGFGKADIGRDIPVTSETLFMLASCSKLFTGTALLKLYEQGRFDLDEDIDTYLPFPVRNPRFPRAEITFRMLLIHTSSIADRQEVISGLYGAGDSDIPLGEFLADYFRGDGAYYSPENFHSFEPGTRPEYSNIGYSLIGYLVERISERPFAEFCNDSLFVPLEMRETSWFLADLEEAHVARHYIAGEDGKGVQPVPHYGWPGYPDGQLRSSAPQVANFLIMVMNEGRFHNRQILRRATIQTMLSRQNFTDLPTVPFDVIDESLMWSLIRLGDREVYMKTGHGSGITTCVLFEPATQTGFVLLVTGPLQDPVGFLLKTVDVLMAQASAVD